MDSRESTWGERTLAELFGSEVRARVLAWLCSRGEGPVIGRELARQLGLPAVTVSDELRRLEALGLIRAGERLGTAKPYSLNTEFPLLVGLRSMVQYAVGAVAALRQKLSARDDVDVAFIYGSLASGDDHQDSDVDLFVVGDIDGMLIARLVCEVEREVGREIELVHWSADDLAQQTDEPSSFLSAVMRQPKVFVKGDEDALRSITGQ